MIIDAQLQFSDSQAVTAAAGSTNTIDLLSANSDLGSGQPLYVVVVCTAAMTDAGSDSTLAVALEGDSTPTFTPDATEALFTFSALSAVGTTKIYRLQPGSGPLQYRYIRLSYTPANGNLTTGSFDAFLVSDISFWNAYADNITIS